MSTYAMSADDWKEWLGTHTDIVRFIEPKEEQQ